MSQMHTTSSSQRHCPRCKIPLSTETLDDQPPIVNHQMGYRDLIAYTIWLDRCLQCDGAFFDHGELERGLREFHLHSKKASAQTSKTNSQESKQGSSNKESLSSKKDTSPTQSDAYKPLKLIPARLLPDKNDKTYNPSNVDSVLGFLAERMEKPWQERSGKLQACDSDQRSSELPTTLAADRLTDKHSLPRHFDEQSTSCHFDERSEEKSLPNHHNKSPRSRTKKKHNRKSAITCPKCGHNMFYIEHRNETLSAHHCKHCGGIWMDIAQFTRRI